MADIESIGTPRCSWNENGGEFLSQDLIDFGNDTGIRRAYTAPDKTKHNAVAKSAIWRTIKAGHAAHCEAVRFFLDINCDAVPHPGGNLGRRLHSLSNHSQPQPTTTMPDLRRQSTTSSDCAISATRYDASQMRNEGDGRPICVSQLDRSCPSRPDFCGNLGGKGDGRYW